MNQNLLVKNFTKPPKGIQYEKDVSTNDYAKFTIYPFKRGFGQTVGNVFRRVLLSSIPGYAITAMKASGYKDDGDLYTISSAFESIPGVKEDTFDIVNNIKNVKLSLLQDLETRSITIDKEGPCVITAADLEVDDLIEVVNKDLHIMTLSEKAKVSFVFQIDLGCGYVDLDRQENYGDADVMTILIDAQFSPVKKIKYDVTDTRIGQRSDFDKLTFELWTDGTITPEDTLGLVAKILTDQFSTFINFKVEDVAEEVVEKDENQELKQFFLHQLKNLIYLFVQVTVLEMKIFEQ